MNPVLLLAHNNLALTIRCIESLRQQALPIDVFVVDNGSRDDTPTWLGTNAIASPQFNLTYLLNPTNAGVSAGWNYGLRYYFSQPWFCDHVLCVGTDTVLAPWFYRELLSYDLPFVTGVAVDQMSQLIEPTWLANPTLEEHPDFSAFLIRKDCWEKVGPFDERMKLYASDCDFHVRAHRLGVPLYKASVPYYHERSSTLRLASPEERDEINVQANKDRAVFYSLYNCVPGQKEYEELFK